MTDRLRSVIVRQPAPPATENDWRAFGYLQAVDHERAVRQHAAFVAALRAEVDEVIEATNDDRGALDAIFAFDPSIVTDSGAILLRPGKALREVEVGFHAATYAELGIPILGAIEAPGTVEGGDTLWFDERRLAVGRGYRTNDAGIAQLTSLLAPLGVEVMTISLPHWRGPSECLHLMSLISPVAEKMAVVYPPLMPVRFVEGLRAEGWHLIEVPEEELDSLGCNVLALAPGRCLVADGNPVTRQRLEAAGCTVIAYDGSEISVNRAGGPTCLTRPLWRAA
jgi:N-dimethylarginine dimethylaminohydrolase